MDSSASQKQITEKFALKLNNCIKEMSGMEQNGMECGIEENGREGKGCFVILQAAVGKAK